MEYLVIIGIIIAFVGILVYWAKSALKGVRVRRLGNKGERIVARKLERLSSKKYRTLNNILLRTPSGFTEIDHIVVSRYGVFVVETKNYNGRIYGEDNAYLWKHYIGHYCHEFQNPIRQNKGHIRAIMSALRGYKNLMCISIIVFPPTTKLCVEGEEAHVVHWNELRSCIKKHSKRYLSQEDVEGIARDILRANVSSKENSLKHVANIKRKH